MSTSSPSSDGIQHSNAPKLGFKIHELSCFQLNPELFAVTIGLAEQNAGKEYGISGAMLLVFVDLSVD